MFTLIYLLPVVVGLSFAVITGSIAGYALIKVTKE